MCEVMHLSLSLKCVCVLIVRILYLNINVSMQYISQWLLHYMIILLKIVISQSLMKYWRLWELIPRITYFQFIKTSLYVNYKFFMLKSKYDFLVDKILGFLPLSSIISCSIDISIFTFQIWQSKDWNLILKYCNNYSLFQILE